MFVTLWNCLKYYSMVIAILTHQEVVCFTSISFTAFFRKKKNTVQEAFRLSISQSIFNCKFSSLSHRKIEFDLKYLNFINNLNIIHNKYLNLNLILMFLFALYPFNFFFSFAYNLGRVSADPT